MEIYLIIIIIALLVLIFKLSFIKNIYTQSTNGISIISNAKVMDCNDKLLSLFEYDSKKQFLQEHPLKLSPLYQPDGSFSFQKANEMMNIAQEEGSHRFDWQFLTKSGQIKNIEIDIIKVNSFFLRKEKYFMIWRDIDKRIEVEEKLKELNANLEYIIEDKIQKNKKQELILLQQSKQAQIGEMLSMIAHQWRQPLGAISSSLIDLRMKIIIKDLNSEELLEYIFKELQNIEDLTQYLTNTVNDFRDFYEFKKDKDNVSILSPLKKAVHIIKKSFQEVNIDLKIINDKDYIVSVFEGEIIQVVLSILQNSKENFIQKDIQNRKIEISIDEDKEHVIVKICDNGKGIKKENLDKIFQPYFTTKEKKNGTGLGLYIVQKIIQEHHNGTIEVNNYNDGVCFNISLKKDGS